MSGNSRVQHDTCAWAGPQIQVPLTRCWRQVLGRETHRLRLPREAPVSIRSPGTGEASSTVWAEGQELAVPETGETSWFNVGKGDKGPQIAVERLGRLQEGSWAAELEPWLQGPRPRPGTIGSSHQA